MAIIKTRIFGNLSYRALFRVGQWVQLHPLILKNAYLQPLILGQKLIETVIFDN